MAVTLDRQAYTEFRRFGFPDEYPKDMGDAVSELRRRGYDASLSLLQRLIDEGALVSPHEDRWSEADIDAAAQELDERAHYTSEAKHFMHLGVDAADFLRSLHRAWDRVRDEFGDAATSINPVQDFFVMTVHPPRMGREGRVEFTLCDDSRRELALQREHSRGIDGLRLPAEEKRRARL